VGALSVISHQTAQKSYHTLAYSLQEYTAALVTRLWYNACAEAILGLLIELSFIATFIQRFFGK
jgi:hypothetical protein